MRSRQSSTAKNGSFSDSSLLLKTPIAVSIVLTCHNTNLIAQSCQSKEITQNKILDLCVSGKGSGSFSGAGVLR